MRKKNILVALVLSAELFMFFAFTNTAHAQIPAPIGDPAYKQKECFDSNPTTGAYDGIGTPTGTVGNVYDGDPEGTLLNFMYGYTASGYVEVSAFRKPSDYGYTDFAITWVDIKISYKAASISTNDDRYRIVAYVYPSATQIVLQDWVTGNEARYDPGVGLRGVRTFSDVVEPNNGTWEWNDVANLEVRFETEQVDTNNWQRVTLFEVWATAYSTPYPAPNTISVQPSAIRDLHAGDLFFVDLYVTNVTKMWGYQFVLEFDPAILMPLGYFTYGPFDTALPSEIGPDYVIIASRTYDGDRVGFTGNTPICRLYFVINMEGISPLAFTWTEFADVFAIYIPLDPVNGFFSTAEVHDVAVTNVTVSPNQVIQGENVTINVDVTNQGTESESFDVMMYYDSTPIGPSQTVTNLLPWRTETLTFRWNTTGVAAGDYFMMAEASPVPGETDTTDNVFVDGQVTVTSPPHDVAVTYVKASPSSVVVSDLVTIEVTVRNQGYFAETFTVTTFYDDTVAAPSQIVTDLAAKASTTLDFTWDTTGVPVGDYTIKAQASTVPEEVDIDDNTYIDGVVMLTHRTLSIKLSGEFDYLIRENVRIKLVTLVRDAVTMDPVSDADVTIEIYDDAGSLWVSSDMVEKITGSGIYEWTSSETILRLRLAKGIYLVRVQASYGGGPIAHDVLLFHIDPPAEGTNEVLYYIAFTVAALAGATGLVLKRRKIFKRLR